MKNKFIKYIIICSICIVGAACFYLLLCPSIKKGKMHDIQEIYHFLGDYMLSEKLEFQGDCFFVFINSYTQKSLYLYGRFSKENIDILLSAPALLGLPPPIINVDAEAKPSAFIFRYVEPLPTEIMSQFLFYKKNSNLYSNLDDKVINFRYKRGKYFIDLYVFCNHGYFIMTINDFLRT